MDTLLVAAIAFAMSQLVLSVLLLLGGGVWSIQQRLFALLLVAVFAYLITPLTNSVWVNWADALATAVPGMFWLFSCSLFDDHFRLHRWQVALVATTVFLPIIGRLLRGFDQAWVEWVFITAPQLLEFILLGLTLLVVARYWRVDLIESRRRLRLWFCGFNGIYIFVLILFRELLFADADWLGTLQYLPVGLTLLATNAILLQYKRGLLVPAEQLVVHPVQQSVDRAVAPSTPEPAIASADEVDPELVDRMKALIEGEGVYREMGLTIGELAHRLEIPEYRLRRTINAGLGYRNFNDFLNSYRIAEASERLANPAQKELPVLTIALDIGFRSLSSFNKAFKDTYHTTPTAYRRQQLGADE
ncbi:helix-turn-helix domain-containing protein [Oceanicoccus sp. KOV_DT_Chl]|uniref:helix-turn-helix domain-containing protein n=1 Tax=Oceanicoccus sp. KOV_DT_Chl TaxID=1904639 RepID=UPI000C7E2A05|nr:helix-turn-helix domain-containing protein [Oceanicoccus sp. KOV_DT_Chl]